MRQTEFRATVNGKEYQARIVNGEVVQVWRITQEAGGHAVGGSVDKFNSISKNNPKFVGVAVAMLRAHQAAQRCPICGGVDCKNPHEAR